MKYQEFRPMPLASCRVKPRRSTLENADRELIDAHCRVFGAAAAALAHLDRRDDRKRCERRNTHQPIAHRSQKAASLAEPGDTVSIRAGTYRETVTPAKSGTPGEPITFAPYDNEQVTISGADPITTWTKYSGSIYDAGMSWYLGTGNNEIFVNGQIINEARWPNTTLQSHIPFATASWATTTSLPTGYAYSDIATLGASGLPGGAGAWKGATIHIATGQGWNVQTGTVLSSSPGRITYAFEHLTAWESPAAGTKFYLTGTFQRLLRFTRRSGIAIQPRASSTSGHSTATTRRRTHRGSQASAVRV